MRRGLRKKMGNTENGGTGKGPADRVTPKEEWCYHREEGRQTCGMLLRSGGMRKEECPLDLATRSPDDIGGRSCTGQVRSETPDVRGWRNNLKGKWRQWRKGHNFQGVCLFARKVKMDQYIQLSFF